MRKVFTVGYEGAAVDCLIATLQRAKVTMVADVRELPLSRKRGFSKRALAERLAAHDIKYEHLKPLGDPKNGRIAARAGRYQEFKEIYLEQLSSDAAQSALRRLSQLTEREAVCLLCFEREPAFCHRSIVVQFLKSLTAPAVHLFCPQVLKYDSKKRQSGHSREGAAAAQ